MDAATKLIKTIEMEFCEYIFWSLKYRGFSDKYVTIRALSSV